MLQTQRMQWFEAGNAMSIPAGRLNASWIAAPNAPNLFKSERPSEEGHSDLKSAAAQSQPKNHMKESCEPVFSMT